MFQKCVDLFRVFKILYKKTIWPKYSSPNSTVSKKQTEKRCPSTNWSLFLLGPGAVFLVVDYSQKHPQVQWGHGNEANQNWDKDRDISIFQKTFLNNQSCMKRMWGKKDREKKVFQWTKYFKRGKNVFYIWKIRKTQKILALCDT